MSNGVARNCPTTAGWGTHTDGEFIKFSNVKSYDCAIGIQVRSPRTELVEGSADRCGIGLLVTGGASAFKATGGVLSNTYARAAPVADMGNAVVIRGGKSVEGTITDVTLTNVTLDGYENQPVKIYEGNIDGTKPTNVKTHNLRISPAPQAPSLGRGVRTGTALYYGPAGALTNDIPAADRLILAPVDVDRICTISELSASINTVGTAGAVTRIGLCKDDGTGVWPGALVVDAGTIDGIVAGVASKTFPAITLMPGRYWVGAVNQGAPTTGAQLRAITTTGGPVLMLSPSADPANYNTGALMLGVTGALPAVFSTAYNVAFNSPRVLMRLS